MAFRVFGSGQINFCCGVREIGEFDSEAVDTRYSTTFPTLDEAIVSAERYNDNAPISIATLSSQQYEEFAPGLIAAGYKPVAGANNGQDEVGNDIILFAKVGSPPKFDSTMELLKRG